MLQANALQTRQHPPHSDLSPVHIRHCIELLRLALMCRPDTTIEKKNETLGGITGFGTEHQCQSWSELLGWVSDWQDWQPFGD